jgi:tRNA(fMet)-specific endonuclease VapC
MSNEFVVLDTNIVSFGFKKDTRRFLYEPHLDGRILAISAQTVAELELMPLKNNWSTQRHASLRSDIRKYIVLEADPQICRLWATIQANARRTGRSIAVGDTWIAATALAYQIPLITHDPGDFDGIEGLEVITEK